MDNNLGDEMRVTVVATGLGRPQTEEKPTVRAVVPPRQTDGRPDYGQLDRPAIIRNNPQTPVTKMVAGSDLEYLDIPAFLRKQAD